METVKEKIVSVTVKGQATLPKEMREKLGIDKKAVAVETKEGILIKPLPRVEDEMDSLKKLFKGRTAKELLSEARKRDIDREKKLEGLV
jgi:AbrB family looped-hinge helix DNA binding protein